MTVETATNYRTTHTSTSTSTSDALIQYSDHILASIDNLLKVEYNKKGRKYRFVNNAFQRIRQEDKHLIICPEQLDLRLSFYSAFLILYNIGQGEILHQFPDFCCTILGLASKLELEHWYEEENSSILHLKNSKIDPRELIQEEADNFIQHHPITDKHITQGVNLLICSKLNFLHTDHHVGTKLEGVYLRNYIEEYFGQEALLSHDVLIALKSCVHWGNIRGVLYKLGVPHIKTTPELISRFASFPEPNDELKQNVYERYPSGTSKYSLLKKAMDILCEYRYARLIKLDTNIFHIEWLYDLCRDIESNPIRYHLRAKTKQLCSMEPVNLSELTMKYSKSSQKLFQYIALIINVFSTQEMQFLMQNSKIPKLNQELIDAHPIFYKSLVDLSKKIEVYELKQWDTGDIIARLQQEINWSTKDSLYSQVMEYQVTKQ